MNVSAAAYRRLAWINLPAAMLITLLQRTPAVRLFTSAGDYVLASPVGQLLRGAITAATLGALHSRAGATTFVLNPLSPISGTVGTPLSAGFTYTGTPSSPARFQITDGALPPGLSFTPTPTANGVIGSGTVGISGTPTQAGNFSVSVQGFNAEGLTNGTQHAIQFTITGGTPGNTAPNISAQPQNQTVTAGGSVTFSVTASGTPAPTFQWRKNGAAISGATNASLTLTNVQTADAGTYSVFIQNSAGSATSNNVTLTVNAAAGQLAIVAQPTAHTVASGHSVVFSVGATGATGFQWRRNGAPIAGATNATLVIDSAAAANAGAYTVVVSGASGGPLTSTAANLAVANTSDFGRLINLSILTDITASVADFTMGYVVGGGNPSATKPLVIRAAGPSLGALGVPGTLANPKIEFFVGETKAGENDNWGGAQATVTAMANVGAFPFVNGTSLDAAVATNVPPSSNSVKVSAVGGGTGTVIAEIYDATGNAFNASTPRLINVSVLKHLGSGLTMGFVVGGTTSKTVLVRAVGPTLGGFGVPGVVDDPELILFGPGGVRFGENNDWGSTVALSNAFQAVGAFGLTAGSRDAALLVTLPPNSYTVDVKGVGGTTGSALIEVYEVP